MAEAIAKLVLDKLVDAAVKEALVLYGAGDKLDSLRHELSYIQAFLKDAESKLSSTNERVKTWVNDVRELAYRIEDVIDTFVAEVDKRNRPGKVNTLKRILKNPKKLPFVHKLISEMDEIQMRLREMEVLTERYGINRELGDNNSSSVQPFIKPLILPDVDDPDIIGLEKDTENIVKLLLNPSTTRRCVVSIVGQGGLGKTTLAKKAFNRDEVKTVFPIRLWLSVSQQFDIVDLLKTMLENIPLSDDEKARLKCEGHILQQRAIEQLNMSLSQKRYLIIMDDVWTDNLWTKIKVALPDKGNGSRVLVTTRHSNIAQKADPACDPYKLHYLSEDESRLLLLKKAFPFMDPEPYLHDLSDLPDKLAKKCGYLPLALVVVGGLLSTKPKTYNSWHKICEKFNWNDEGLECTEILTTSFEDLSVVLKSCFMYFGLFPEDYRIKAKSLIRMWVAEGFMPKEDKKTMEETAEGWLEELVQRSMIQVSERSLNGSIKYCRIHDLLHELAIEKGKESGFLEIISSQDGSSSSSTISSNVRRAALHFDRKDIMENAGPNLRSLLSFSEHDLPDFKMFRFLKVLNGLESSLKGNNIKKLAQLRYIAIGEIIGEIRIDSHCGPIILAERQIWKGMSRMRNLQTLHIRKLQYEVRYLINCIWDIKTLRHVIVRNIDNIYGPPSRAELPNLQTLKIVAVREEWVTKGWPRMPSIRVLKICGLSELPPNYQSFCTFLNGLHHLTSLAMRNEDIAGPLYFDPRDMSKFPWYKQLQSLNLDGRWIESKGQESVPGTVSERSFPIHLTKLRLVDSRITEDPMPVLERLENLSLLELHWDAYAGRELRCSARGFPRLQILNFFELHGLEEWKVDVGDGAVPIMPMLKEIKLSYCRKLRLIPGLRFMTSLSKFTLDGCSPDLYQSLREDESHQIREGQFIEFDIK